LELVLVGTHQDPDRVRYILFSDLKGYLLIDYSQLIPYYARYQASQPTMWGGHTPSADQITQLTTAFVAEWDYALGQMLRHWEQPPTR
jgi:hypothetical protein